MRKNARKSKPNTQYNQQHNIRSSSIRDIIGDRRFNDQFSHVNTHETEGNNRVERVKIGDTEGNDLPNWGRNVSSVQRETMDNPQCCYGDFAAKTSEYAFFKRMKENKSNDVHVHPRYHDNKLNDAQQSDHLAREEIPSVQKESVKHVGFSLPVRFTEKERNDTHSSLLSTPSPCYGTKKREVKNVYGANTTNAQHIRPGEYNWLSSSVDSKTKSSKNKGVFSAKREKLRHWIDEKSSYDDNELSSKGLDLVSALISRILPEDRSTNSRKDHVLCQDETDTKYKLPSFSESEAHEAYKRKLIESHRTSYLDNGLSRSTKRLKDMDLLEWDSAGHAPNSSMQYNRSHTEAYNTNLTESHHISYLDGGFSRATKRHIDIDLLEWDTAGHAPKSSIQYNPCHTEPYKRKLDSCHISYLDDHFTRSGGELVDMDLLEWNPTGSVSSVQHDHRHAEETFRIPNFDIKSILSFDVCHPSYEPKYSQDFNESYNYGPKLLEPPHPLLLGWETNSKKDEYQLSTLDSQTEINTCSTSQNDDYHISNPNTFVSSPPSSPYIHGHLKKEHYLASLTSPYSPKHLMPVEDYAWCMNESLNEKEHRDSDSFVFLIQSPENNLLGLLNTGVNSLVVNDEEDKFLCSPDQFSDGRVKAYGSNNYVETFYDRSFDHSEYPLLLYDSSRNNEL